MNADDALRAKWVKITRFDNLHVVVIGCGGTGSKLVPELCQALALFASSQPESRTSSYYRPTGVKLTLVDPDIVEEKNLTRQHFIRNDLGRNKAQVLAERYAAAFGLTIGCQNILVDTPADLRQVVFQPSRPGELVYAGFTLYVIFTAVDNHPTRRVVHEFLSQVINEPTRFTTSGCPSIFWVDLANEETAGQICVGFHNSVFNEHLPFATEVFPEILETEPDIRPSQRPCGDGGIQDLNVNAAAATHASSFFRQLLKVLAERNGSHHKLMNYHYIDFGVFPPTVQVRLNLKEVMQDYEWLTTRRWEQTRYWLER